MFIHVLTDMYYMSIYSLYTLYLSQQDLLSSEEVSVVFGEAGHLREKSRLVPHCHLHLSLQFRVILFAGVELLAQLVAL